jgi:hypothetical protein
LRKLIVSGVLPFVADCAIFTPTSPRHAAGQTGELKMADCEFEFQQLCPRDDMGREIYGIEISGTAYLESSRDDGSFPNEFYVDAVEILGAKTITRRQAEASPSSFNGQLFKVIANQIENGNTDLGKIAQAEFSGDVESEIYDQADSYADYRREFGRSA